MVLNPYNIMKTVIMFIIINNNNNNLVELFLINLRPDSTS